MVLISVMILATSIRMSAGFDFGDFLSTGAKIFQPSLESFLSLISRYSSKGGLVVNTVRIGFSEKAVEDLDGVISIKEIGSMEIASR